MKRIADTVNSNAILRPSRRKKTNIFPWGAFLLFVTHETFINVPPFQERKWSAAWLHYISIAFKLAYSQDKLFKTLHYWFRDMLNLDFLVWEEFLQHILCMIFRQKCPFYILLTDQISLSGCLYFLRYWTIYVFQLFVNQVVTLWTLKLNLSF